MERNLQIVRVNLKHFMLPHLVLCILLMGLSPLFIGIENLDASRTARVLEMFVALAGIIMLTPIFLPEQNADIRELVEAKHISYTKVLLIRMLESLFCLMLFIGLYIALLSYNNCSFPILYYYLGTLAEALFLGGMGLCAFSLFDQIAIGYLLPVMYYIMAFGGGTKLLKGFYPFSMIYGSYLEKVNLAVLGGVLIIIGLCYPYLSKKLIPRLYHTKIT